MLMVGPEALLEAPPSQVTCYLCSVLSTVTGSLNFFQIMLAAGVEFGSRNVLADPAIREAIKEYSNWPTIPQVQMPPQYDTKTIFALFSHLLHQGMAWDS